MEKKVLEGYLRLKACADADELDAATNAEHTRTWTKCWCILTTHAFYTSHTMFKNDQFSELTIPVASISAFDLNSSKLSFTTISMVSGTLPKHIVIDCPGQRSQMLWRNALDITLENKTISRQNDDLREETVTVEHSTVGGLIQQAWQRRMDHLKATISKRAIT